MDCRRTSHGGHLCDPSRRDPHGDGENFSGLPRSERHPILNVFAERVLARDIATVPDVLVVLLGKTVGDAVVRVGLAPGRVLAGFPHPSGSNGHRAHLYVERHRELAAAVNAWAGV